MRTAAVSIQTDAMRQGPMAIGICGFVVMGHGIATQETLKKAAMNSK